MIRGKYKVTIEADFFIKESDVKTSFEHIRDNLGKETTKALQNFLADEVFDERYSKFTITEQDYSVWKE